MTRYLFRWLATSLIVLMVPHVISGVHVDGFVTALAVAAVLGLLNTLLRPVLVFLTLPLTILTLGLFLLVLNAFMFQLAAALVVGFRVDSFGAAFLASILVTVVSWVLNLSGKKDRASIQMYRWQGGNGQRTRDVN